MAGIFDYLSQVFGGDQSGGAPVPQTPAPAMSPTAQFVPMPSNWTQGASITGQAPQAPAGAAAPSPAAAQTPTAAPQHQGWLDRIINGVDTGQQQEGLYQPNAFSDPSGHFSVRNFVGTLGDALSGHPIYTSRIQAQQQASAISQFLADPNPVPSPEAISRLAKFDPDMASSMYEKAQAARMAMVPKYTKDDSGNIWKESFGQPPVLVSKGPGKITDIQPGHVSEAVNPYGLAGADGAAVPAGVDAGAAAPPASQATDTDIFDGAVSPAAQAHVESGGNPNAVSTAGATGTMQTMPQTLSNPGYGVAPAKDNSPEEKARVGRDYSAAMTQKYGPAIGLVAYNMGPGKTDAWLSAGGKFSDLPPETQAYVGRVAVTQAMQARGTQSAPASAPQGASQYARVLARGPQEWRDLTPGEASTHPEAEQINDATGELKLKPMALLPSQLSPEAIKQGAAYYIKNGGKFPGTMRDRASIAAVQNYVATLKPEGMSDDDWARVIQNNGLALVARHGAAGQAGKAQVATAINEGTVNNSIGILRNLIPLAASTGPVTDINSLTQAIARHSNDANAANFKNAIDSISSEYARVMTGSTTGAPSSDSARKEAGERILYGYNNKTLPQVLDQMQAEMRGRSASYADVLKQITGGSYSGANVPFTQPQAQGGAKSALPSGWKYLGAVKK